MKIGPFYISRRPWPEASASAETERALAELRERLYWHEHAGFKHFMLGAKVGRPVVCEPDGTSPRTLEAIDRVMAAYHRAQTDLRESAPSTWDLVKAAFFQDFVRALETRDSRSLQRLLAKMFQNNVTWGMARTHESWPRQMRENPEKHYFPLRISDVLHSLGEAVGVVQTPSLEQSGMAGYTERMREDPAGILQRVEKATGLDLSFPRVGAAMGVDIGGRWVNIDSLLHSYTVWRLGQLGARRTDRIVEIGGGYGCMACLFFRAGFRSFEIVDLPWVNAVQGYFLLSVLPPDSVCLYGENRGSLKVMPTWYFQELPDRSVDYVVNVNSLPEIGAESAREYLRQIARVVRKLFVSVNQEARRVVPGVGPQNRVAEMAAETGAFETVYRFPWWMEQGYVEEVFRPR